MNRWAAIIVCLLPLSATAEVVPLQVGEQGDYTRLVLTLPEPEGWTVTQENRSLTIQIPAASSFDFRDFTDLVGSRIAAFRTSDANNTLMVDLNCECTVSSYLLGNLFLTIDIAGTVALRPDLAPLNAISGLAQPWHSPLTQSLTEPSPDTASPASTDPETTLNALDTAVSTGLAAATYQGFLNIQTGIDELANAPDISTDLLDNITVGVQSQLSTLNADTTAIPDAVVFSCKDVSTRLTADWQLSHSFSIERGMVHSMFVADEEQTEVDRSAAIALAILFVGQGLGYEALAVLEDVDDPDDLTRALTYMAKVIDAPIPPELIGLENCPEDLAYWAFLHSAGRDEVVDALDPRSLMLTFKLLPQTLQTRTLDRFGDALARAGHDSYQAELQAFKNTYFAVTYADSGAPPPVIDFNAPASAREILRADLTERDLDPSQETSKDPTQLTLELLDSLRIERRGTPAEAALLDAVLDRHVTARDYITVMNLLIDAQPRIEPAEYDRMLGAHLGESVAGMTDPELLAFAFRSDLPPLPDDLRGSVAARLSDMQVLRPGQFADINANAPDVTPADEEVEAPPENADFTLPVLVDIPDDAMPSFAETEALIAGSEAMRNAIETLINDTN